MLDTLRFALDTICSNVLGKINHVLEYGGRTYNYRSFGQVSVHDNNEISQFEKTLMKIALKNADRSITPGQLKKQFYEMGIVKDNSLKEILIGEYALLLSKIGITKDSTISYQINDCHTNYRYEIKARLVPHGDFHMWKVNSRLIYKN